MVKPIVDMACGSKMFYFDKANENVLFIDNRTVENEFLDSKHTRTISVKPDIKADFTNLPIESNTKNMVIFDPPHLKQAGKNSWLAKKYGVLDENWPTMINQGFHEAMRVLKPYGTLIFKWNEEQIKLSEVLKAIDYEPIFGNKRNKTHWLVFMKLGSVE